MDSNTLMAHVQPILSRNRNDILQHLPQAALRNDDTMRVVASFCYRSLPFPVRMVVKEAVFASFVLQYRDKIMDALLAEPIGTVPAGSPQASSRARFLQ